MAIHAALILAPKASLKKLLRTSSPDRMKKWTTKVFFGKKTFAACCHFLQEMVSVIFYFFFLWGLLELKFSFWTLISWFKKNSVAYTYLFSLGTSDHD